MAKKFICFEFEDTLNPKYKKWAREAVEEFINLFPEYKDCFEISNKEQASFFTRQEVEDAFKSVLQANPDLDLSSLISQFYEKQADGRYLRKGSIEHMLKRVTVNGLVDLEKWFDLKKKETQKMLGIREDQRRYESDITLSVTSKNARKGFAFSGWVGPCISSTDHYGDNKDYFKRTVIHELGHAFQMAGHEHTQTNTWGTHCTDAACLGSQSGSCQQGACFCEHCMGAMREEMEHIKQALKEKENQSANDNQATDTPQINESDFLAGLSSEEKIFLKDYLDYIRSNGIHRSQQDLLWDWGYLLDKFRRQHRNSSTAAQTLKQEFKTIAETFDWKKEEHKSKLSKKTRQKLETLAPQKTTESIEISDQPLQQNAENDKSKLYKTQLRGILRESAKAENLDYAEEPRTQGFKAELKANDGSKTIIEAANPKQISLTAQDANGEKVTPSFRRFMDIVSYAQLRHSSVSFGDIKTPEFKANLMIACLKAQPPVRMKGAPKMTEEFLNTLNPATAKILHEAYYSRKIEKEFPSNTGLKRSQAERYFELKKQSKNPNQTPREWAELFYLEDQLVGDIALEEAERRFNSPRPREEEWRQKTGYAPERVVHYKNKRPGDASWKLHLDVTPNCEEPTTKAITEYLHKLDIDYKICGGEENGKGITVYVGSYQDVSDLSTRLQMEFGEKVKLPARYTDQFNQEMEFHNVATGRFMIAANFDPKTKTETPVFDEVYPTTIRGISPARLEAHDSLGFLIKNAKQMGLAPQQTPDDYKQITDAKQHYDIDMLENYVSHRLYAKHLGTFYHGTDAQHFEKQLFHDTLPKAGSMERRKWDMLADRYERFIQENCPEKLDLMKKHIEGYRPIDFTKENTATNTQQQSNSLTPQQIIASQQNHVH